MFHRGFKEFIELLSNHRIEYVVTEPNGAAAALIMEKMASRQALSEIKDPSAWQREIRKDRPLPGR